MARIVSNGRARPDYDRAMRMVVCVGLLIDFVLFLVSPALGLIGFVGICVMMLITMVDGVDAFRRTVAVVHQHRFHRHEGGSGRCRATWLKTHARQPRRPPL